MMVKQSGRGVQQKEEGWQKRTKKPPASSFLASALPASSYKGLISAVSFPSNRAEKDAAPPRCECRATIVKFTLFYKSEGGTGSSDVKKGLL
jgi:hypothetical protein